MTGLLSILLLVMNVAVFPHFLFLVLISLAALLPRAEVESLVGSELAFSDRDPRAR